MVDWVDDAHFVSPGKQIVHKWRSDAKYGDIFQNDNGIIIRKSGYYYVYCQMHYNNGHRIFMAHMTYKNDWMIPKSLSSPVSTNRRHYTNYQGGVFYLKDGDRLTVRVLSSSDYRMDSVSSYFGAFRLR